MSFQEEKRESIKRYMLKKIRQDDVEFIQKTMENFEISITTVKRYIRECLDNQILCEDKEKVSGYKLISSSHKFSYQTDCHMDEDAIYYDDIFSLLEDVSKEAKSIWYYAFTEMMNNAIEHSECGNIQCVVKKDYLYTEISITDDGVGIYKNVRSYFKEKLKRDISYQDVLMELYKGKMTTKSENHSGEGIFFTSKVLNEFAIWSDNAIYSQGCYDKQRFVESHLISYYNKLNGIGTMVVMKLENQTTRTIKEVFDVFAPIDEGFVKTRIPLAEVCPFAEPVARSQARRILYRLEQFKQIEFDFAGVAALAFPARENGHEVRLVGTHLDREIIDACRKEDKHPKFDRVFPAGIKYYQIEEVDEAIAGSTFIIGGVSSFGVDWFGDVILPKIPEEIPVLSVTKGLVDTLDGKLLTYPDVWEAKCKELGKNLSINAIGGPCTSYELVFHDQTEVAFCGRDMEILKMMKEVMATSYYHISLSTDVVGIESAVALKNGYALGIALTIGLNQKEFGLDSQLHFNSQAAIFGQAVKEMYRLLAYQGAATLENMSVGYGDLYVTVYGGRTRLVGILLGRGLNIDEAKEELNGVTLESLVVAERVARAIKVAAANGVLDAKDFPLLMHVDEIICDKKEVNLPWEDFTFVAEV